MQLLLYIFLALRVGIYAEEENKTKQRRGVFHPYNGQTVHINDSPFESLLNVDHGIELSGWNSAAPLKTFLHLFPKYLYPEIFGEDIYNPDYVLTSHLNYPVNIRVAPPVSFPKAVTPKPPSPNVYNSVPRPLSYGVSPTSLSSLQHPVPPAPPIPAPIQPPSQIGRLGSGSLGYVHLGNGLFALGSGSLGYTPPAATGARLPPIPSFSKIMVIYTTLTSIHNNFKICLILLIKH